MQSSIPGAVKWKSRADLLVPNAVLAERAALGIDAEPGVDLISAQDESDRLEGAMRELSITEVDDADMTIRADAGVYDGVLTTDVPPRDAVSDDSDGAKDLLDSNHPLFVDASSYSFELFDNPNPMLSETKIAKLSNAVNVDPDELRKQFASTVSRGPSEGSRSTSFIDPAAPGHAQDTRDKGKKPKGLAPDDFVAVKKDEWYALMTRIDRLESTVAPLNKDHMDRLAALNNLCSLLIRQNGADSAQQLIRASADAGLRLSIPGLVSLPQQHGPGTTTPTVIPAPLTVQALQRLPVSSNLNTAASSVAGSSRVTNVSSYNYNI